MQSLTLITFTVSETIATFISFCHARQSQTINWPASPTMIITYIHTFFMLVKNRTTSALAFGRLYDLEKVLSTENVTRVARSLVYSCLHSQGQHFCLWTYLSQNSCTRKICICSFRNLWVSAEGPKTHTWLSYKPGFKEKASSTADNVQLWRLTSSSKRNRKFSFEKISQL